jgi:hypothetical protein
MFVSLGVFMVVYTEFIDDLALFFGDICSFWIDDAIGLVMLLTGILLIVIFCECIVGYGEQ